MTEYIATWANDPLGYLHLAAAMIALVSGAVVAVLRKGNAAHVWLGRAYLAAMLFVNGSALSKYDLTGRPNVFHLAAILSLATVIAGWIAAQRHRKTGARGAAAAHGIFMLWSYFGLIVALIAETVTREFPYMLHGQGGWLRFVAATGAFMIVAGFFYNRYVRREVRRTLG